MPADTVLAALESYADDMVMLANEVRRPKSRFDNRYEDSFNDSELNLLYNNDRSIILKSRQLGLSSL